MAQHRTTELAVALVVGVESGSSGGSTDLIWAPVLGRPLLAWSVEVVLNTGVVTLERHDAHDHDGIAIARVILIVAPERVADAEALCDRESWSRPTRRVVVVPGGPRRRDAVRAGLAHLTPQPPSLMEGRGSKNPVLAAPPQRARSKGNELTIVIHDAARPLVTPDLIEAALVASTRASAATAVEPVKETLKLVRDGRVAGTVPRERLVQTQTPQVFRLETLLAAYAAADPAFGSGRAADGQRTFRLPASVDPPDDAALILAAGLPMATFPGSPENLKVRTATDLAVVERLLAIRHGEH